MFSNLLRLAKRLLRQPGILCPAPVPFCFFKRLDRQPRPAEGFVLKNVHFTNELPLAIYGGKCYNFRWQLVMSSLIGHRNDGGIALCCAFFDYYLLKL